MNADAQLVHSTTLKSELDVFDHPSASNLLPGYSVSHEFVKDVPHAWNLNCCLPLALCQEALEQLYNNKSPFLKAVCIDHCLSTTVYFTDLNVLYMPDLIWLLATGTDLKAMGAHRGDHRAM